ncbi:MAG TPA: LuxR C-terminal-related transcriptional regulator [Chitinophagales bacterium]|nr:LuxR C-terminal-related transcriptional regulator [Chitinophagales bacterium]
MVSIFEFENFSYSMVYANSSAYSFLGVTEEEINRLGFKYILKLIHPENISSIYLLIKFYNDSNNKNNTFSHTYYLKSKNGWEWTYASVKPAILNSDGGVKYLIGVGCSVDDLLKNKKQVSAFRKNINFLEDNTEKYLILSDREKEVLELICEEYTSKEIALRLSISALTVDTHRKNLIDKLGVKSSIGLVKYAILFNLL